jgi:tight adherence protein B
LNPFAKISRAFRLRLAAAGLGHVKASWLLVTWFTCLVLASLIAVRLSGLTALGLAVAFLGSALSYETLLFRDKSRRDTLVAVLPQICESLSSAVSTGLDLQVAFADLAAAGPKPTRNSLQEVSRQLDHGVQFEVAMEWLKADFAVSQADLLIELLKLTRTSGGVGLVGNLNRLAHQLRQQAALSGEIGAKQGWVTGTAKLALATPWLVVLMLGTRPENALAYNSQWGLIILSIGLALCLVAYLIINLVSVLPQPKRVFAK